MVKKKTAKKKATKHLHNEKVVHRDVASRNSDESPLIEMNQSTILTGAIFLLVGLIIGALIVSAVGVNPIKDTSSTCTVDLGSDNMATEEELTTYLNSNLLDPSIAEQGLSFTIEDTNDLSKDVKGYNVLLNDGSGLSQLAGIIYVSGDEFIIAQTPPININEEIPTNQNNQASQSAQTAPVKEMTKEEKDEIANFNSCLEEKGVKVYGANWCGYTKALIENIGGFELAEPVYIECTENEELCSSEGITGYPTIKMNGEVINPQRNFEGLASATGCEAPKIEFSAATTQAGACN